MTATLRWGIVSAGKISHDFCVALGTLPTDKHQVLAVAARDKSRAKEFAKKHEIPNAYGSYNELAQDPDINIIYVGALNRQHFEVSMLMLEHGKHVLCEKPLCINHKQAQQLIKYAERKQLFLMESVWSRFFPAYQYLRQQIAADVLGDIQEVEVSLGAALIDVDRLSKKDLGGGAVLDMGIYTIQFAQWVFQEPPQKIVAEGELNAEGVDIYVKTELHYTGGRVAKLRNSAKGVLENKAVVKGTKGQITLINFWCPIKIIGIDGKEKEWVLPKGKYPTNFTNSEGFCYEAASIYQSIMAGKLQDDVVTHDDSLTIAKIQDEIRRQIGVIYEEDASEFVKIC